MGTETSNPFSGSYSHRRSLTRRFIRKLKVFEAVIDSRNYDFIRFGIELDRYLVTNDVPAQEKYRIRLAIEELVQQILLPGFDDPDISVSVERSMKDNVTEISVRYGKIRFQR